MARVKQILVVRGLVRFQHLGHEMIEIEFTRHSAPPLTNQAVDTPKSEVVAEPRSIGPMIRVACGAMASRERLWRVGKRVGHCSVGRL